MVIKDILEKQEVARSKVSNAAPLILRLPIDLEGAGGRFEKS